MKKNILSQSEEIPESNCRTGFSFNLSKLHLNTFGYWRTVTSLLVAFLLFSNASWGQAADIDQLRNGGVGETPTPNNWSNGNLGPENTHLLEGYSVPYRAILTGLTVGTDYTIQIGIDTRDSGAAALDYFTSFQRLDPHAQFGHTAEVVNPLFGLAGSFSGPVTSAIPVPSNTGTPVAGMPASSFNALPAGERNFSMWNGTFIGALTYSLQETLSGAASKTNIQISFTANAATVVLAWGGHIASNAASEWNGGAHPGGSPYHCRIVGLGLMGGTLSGGSMDRSLKSDAVIVPPVCDATGPASVCGGSSNVYSTPSITGATYLWTLSNNTSGASISGSATDASVTVNSGAGPGSYTITVVVTKILPSTPCPVTTTVNVGAEADAGPDDDKCQTPPSGPTSFTLAGTASGGTTLWEEIAHTGTASSNIATPSSLTSTVSVSGVGTVTLRLTATSNTTPPCGNDTDTVVLTVYANPAPTAQNLADCEVNQTGSATFNLADGLVSADGGSVRYFGSLADANAGTNALTAAGFAVAKADSPKTIWIRSDNDSDGSEGCYGLTTFTISVYDNPAPTAQNLADCEVNQTGSATFNLADGLVSADGGSVRYFGSLADANAGTNALTAAGFAVAKADSPKTIWIRSDNDSDGSEGCYGLTTFTISVYDNPAPTAQNLADCEVNQTGSATFNLADGLVNADGGSVRYFGSLADANAGTNALTAAGFAVAKADSPKTIWIRSDNDSDGSEGCYGLTTFTISVYDNPAPTAQNLAACQIGQTGSATFNLAGGLVNADGGSVRYFGSLADANAGTNALTPAGFALALADSPKTIWIRSDNDSDGSEGCYGLTTFTITVYDNPAPTAQNLAACEIDGSATFNLADGLVNADGGSVRYFGSLADANAGTNALTPAGFVVALADSPKTIWIRSDNDSDGSEGCYGLTTFTITVNPLPAVTCPGDSMDNLVQCGVSASVAQGTTDTAFNTWLNSFALPAGTSIVSVVYDYTPDAAEPASGHAPLNPILGVPGSVETSVLVTWTIKNNVTLCENSCSATFALSYNCTIGCDNSKTDVLCKGASTGSITVTAQGGTPDYTVKLFKLPDAAPPVPIATRSGISTSTVNELFSNLSAGTYRYEVTDATSAEPCNNENPIVISEPDTALDLVSLAPTNASCGLNDGTILATISGGTPPYTIKLDSGSAVSPNGAGGTTHTFTGVAPGPHTVTVYDANYATSPLAGCTDSGETTIDSNPCGGHIFPTQTACCNIVAGNVEELTAVCYKPRAGKVWNAIPGVFFYYTKVVAPSSTFTLNVVQTKSCGDFKLFAVQQGKDIKLFGPNCVRVNSVVVSEPSTGQARMVVSGATAGVEYVLGVKYETKSIIGSTYTVSPPVCTYDFVTNVSYGAVVNQTVANSSGSIEARPGCADDTPLPPACSSGVQVVDNDPAGQSTLNMFSAYPVPFKDNITIRYDFDYHSKARIEIYDAKGIFVMSYDDADAYFNKEVRLDVKFNQGDGQMYIIKVITDKEVGTKRIISTK